MIGKILIGLGLVVTPFICLEGFERREQQFITSLLMAFALSLWVIFNGKIKKLVNRWVYIFLAYLAICGIISPFFYASIFGVDSTNFWMFKGLLSIFVFALFIISVASIKPDDEILLKIMMYSGVVMGWYAIIQYCGFEQLFRISLANEALNTPQRVVCGTLGHPTFLASFLAMIIPISIYFKKYILSVFLAFVVFLTHSIVGIGAMILSVTLSLSSIDKRFFNIFLSMVFSVVVFMYIFSGKVEHLSNGRFVMWRDAVSDLKTPLSKYSDRTFGLTGFGIGSFRYMFNIRHPNIHHGIERNVYFPPWRSAHNEYIQILYETGAIGIVLFMFMMLNFIKESVGKSAKKICLLSSFICIGLCAAGSFVWQLGPTMYYTAFLVGLLSNTEG